MNKLRENPLLEIIVNVITTLTAEANLGKYKRKNTPVEPKRFTLEELFSCFLGINQEKFLTESPLKSYLQGFSRNEKEEKTELSGAIEFGTGIDTQFKKPVRKVIPEGAQITFSVLPCTINGLPLVAKDFDDTRNDDYQYFHVFYSNPKNEKGLSKTGECQEYAPYLKVIPKEFLIDKQGQSGQECSFIVKYPSSSDEKSDIYGPDQAEKDYQYFEAECTRIYKNLSNIAKQTISKL